MQTLVPLFYLSKILPANIRLGEDVLKTSSTRLQDVFSVTFFCLPRRRVDVLKTSLRPNCKTSCKTSWKRFEDVLRRRIANTPWRRLEDVFNTFWRRLGKQEMFAGLFLILYTSLFPSFCYWIICPLPIFFGVGSLCRLWLSSAMIKKENIIFLPFLYLLINNQRAI